VARAHEKPSLCNWWRQGKNPFLEPSDGTAACFLQNVRFEIDEHEQPIPVPLARLLYVTTPADIRVRQDGTGGDTVIITGLPTSIYFVRDVQILNLDTDQQEMRLVLFWDDQQGFPILIQP